MVKEKYTFYQWCVNNNINDNTADQLEQYINNKRKQLGINIPFTIDSYLSGNILKPDDIQEESEWIFNKYSIEDLKGKNKKILSRYRIKD